MKNYVLKVLFLLVLASCNHGRENVERVILDEHFGAPIALTREVTKAAEYLNVAKMVIKDSILVVQNFDRQDSLIVLYDLNDFDCLGGYFKAGKGPGEYGEISLVNLEERRVGVFDRNRDCLEVFGIDRENGLHEVSRHDNFNALSYEYHDSGEGFLYGFSVLGGEARSYIGHRKQDAEIDTIYSFQDLSQKYHPNVYDFKLSVNPNQRKLAVAYSHIRRIDVVGFDGTLIKKLEMKSSVPPVLLEGTNMIDAYKSKYYYYEIKSNDDFFVVANIGLSAEEAESGQAMSFSYEVFDWDGNPLKKYQSDMMISAFSLMPSSDSLKLVGFSTAGESPLVVLKGEL